MQPDFNAQFITLIYKNAEDRMDKKEPYINSEQLNKNKKNENKNDSCEYAISSTYYFV